MKVYQLYAFGFVLLFSFACVNKQSITETRSISSVMDKGVLSDNFEFDCEKTKSKKGNTCAEVYPLRGYNSNTVTKQYIFSNATEDLNARLKTIENAKKSIRIQALIFHGDELGRYITEILKRKLREERAGDKISTYLQNSHYFHVVTLL